MAKKNKNNKHAANKPLVIQKPEQKGDVTIETVKASVSEAEFEKNKETLIEKLKEEIGQLEQKKANAEKAVEDITAQKEKLEETVKELNLDKEKLQGEYEEIESKYLEAVGTVDSATENANKIRADAEKERADTLLKAAEEARDAFRRHSDSIKEQIDGIAAKEKELHESRMKLEQERRDFNDEKAELDDLKEYVQKLKERYASLSPAKMESLVLECQDAQAKYKTLLDEHTALAGKLAEKEVLLDTVKTELEDSNGGERITLRQIVQSLQELREKHDRLASVYSKYPDDASIHELEERARKADNLAAENHALIQERNAYRNEAAAARNAKQELEVIRQEVEATDALNKHLLQELESHKTALESRNGDTCPSLSKVDTETEEPDFVADIASRVKRTELASLQEIVQHVKNYAGSRKKDEQLFYTDNDIRAFLAGMAVSRLIILQGMSGTGKSSLPRIFSEAISGYNRLIPVESSWRDRNELLGYYNDFNKKFNAKSFTIELYRSAKERCQVIPTFIVLDEMNLARIEYYFSDFLAILQEPDHNKWLIELVSSDMRTLPMELPEDVKRKMKEKNPTVFAIWEKIERARQGDLKSETSDEEKELLTGYLAKLGKLTGAKDLIDGRKIKVTDNIWFVGTANQDESTFEISDKVYDRAQVVSLNKKGVSEGDYKSTDKKYVSVAALQGMFVNAISEFKSKDEVEKKLETLDNLLMEKFDMSFGNRIVTQTIDFAAVFTAAGGKLADALDYQISTKILRKIISNDDGEAFLELLDATQDYPETQRLINKRIKDLR